MNLSYGYASFGDERWINLYRTPWYLDLLETVCDRFCAFTGHRLCVKLMTPVMTAVHKRTESFRVEANDDTITRFCEWMGWERPFWVDDEDEEDL